MTVLLYSHDIFLDHDTGPAHPERPDRLRSVLAALAGERFAALERREAPEASIDQLTRVHPRAHVERVLDSVPVSGLASVDPDTVISPASGAAALRAAGALCAAVDAVIAGDAKRAFCAVRPPGHHAEPQRAMGFCLFNNVAVGAAHARAAHGLRRIAIVDFDVHHGNGTQAAFANDPAVLFGSSHQMPLYPGTGAASETGLGNIVNMPLAPGSTGEHFRAAWREAFVPRLEAFRPHLILVSAGFDGHRDDPLANLGLNERDYAWITAEIVRIAEDSCGGRVVSTLEGGYDLAALGTSAAAHVEELMTA
jgi:acetoin utilization deacetylase AcuC-like enzyme